MHSRTVKTRRIGDKTVHYTVRIVDTPSEPGTREAADQQRRLLQELVDQPSLLMCGPVPFATLRMHHNGTAWVVEIEADVFTDTTEEAQQS